MPGVPQVQVAPADYQGGVDLAHASNVSAAKENAAYGRAYMGDLSNLAGTLGMGAMMAGGAGLGAGLLGGAGAAALPLLFMSDERLKEDIEPYTGGLAEVMSLNPVEFDYKPGTGLEQGRQHGLVAQDVAQTMPQAVAQTDGGALAVDYAKLIPELVAALQEQQTQIGRLSAMA
ncbi:MAG: tail fiber domain-containing protein [Gammaproteobacteria bacterium]